MFLELFLFAKLMKFWAKGGIHCFSGPPGAILFYARALALVELMEYDNSAADIMVHSTYIYCMYCCIHMT